MGLLSRLFGTKEKRTTSTGYVCFACGKCGEPILQGAGGQVTVGRPDQLRNKILKCSQCGKYVCGACAGGKGVLVCPTCKEPCAPCDWTRKA